MNRILFKALAAVSAGLLVSSCAFAAGIAHIEAAEGRVDMISPGDSSARPVVTGDRVLEGSVIRTKSLSKARIVFSDDTSVSLAANTKVSIDRYELDDFGLRKEALITLHRGEMRAQVEKNIDGKSFLVETPNAVGNVEGTEFYVFYEKSSTGVLVKDGVYTVTHKDFPNERIEVAKGYTTVVPYDRPPAEPRPYFDFEADGHESKTVIARLPVPGDPSHITGVVTKVSGEVKLKKGGADGWKAAAVNDPLIAGDALKTEKSGKLEFKLDNGHIVSLKPNSDITLKGLKRDTEADTEENLFVSNMGNIRAKVQKLKEGSKFEIKTPTAVAAVRGTIMYVTILPGLTQVYFEEGDGTITSIVSKVSKNVAKGNTSSADKTGGVTDPKEATDDEKSEWSSGWDPNEEYGYSPAGGGDTGLGGDSGSDTGAGGETGDDTYTGGGSDTAGAGDDTVTVPPDTDGDTGGGGSEGGSTGSAESTGYFGYFSEGEFVADQDSSIAMEFDTTSAGDNTLEARVSGEYSNEEGYSLWLADMAGEDDTGTSYKGLSGGNWHSWEGPASGIFVEPDGTAGTLLGYLEGTTAESAEGVGTLEGDGILALMPLVKTDVTPEELLNPESGVLHKREAEGSLNVHSREGNPYFVDTFKRDYTFIDDGSWGSWAGTYEGFYRGPETSAGYMMTGGGALRDESMDAYLFAVVNAEDNLEGSLRMDIVESYLSPVVLGASFGTVLGDYYTTEGTYFEGIGTGIYMEAPLTLSGIWNSRFMSEKKFVSDIGSLYANNSGDILEVGTEYGLIGSVIPGWGANDGVPFPVVAMGSYLTEGSYDKLLWNSPIYSSNDVLEDSTTLDGGAFFGASTGIWSEGVMDGYSAAVYAYPVGDSMYNVGFLTGPAVGGYDESSGMWILNIDDSSLSPEVMDVVEFGPGDLESGYYLDGMDSASFYGTFDGDTESSISGSLAFGYRIGPEDEADFGIFDIKLGDGNTFYNSDSETYTDWTAKIGGKNYYYDDDEEEVTYWIADASGDWVDGEIRGDVEGYSLSSQAFTLLDGKLFGINSGDDGDWVASSVGTWRNVLTPGLVLSDGDTEEGGFFHFSDGGFNLSDNSLVQVVAASENLPWEGDTGFGFLGEYKNPSNDRLWGILVNNLSENNGTALLGMLAGAVGNDNSLSSLALAYYVRPRDGEEGYKAGCVSSTDLTGDIYPGIGMLEAGGTIQAYYDGATDILPLELDPENYDLVYYEDHEGHIFNEGGYVSDGEVILESIDLDDPHIEDKWSIWSFASHGTFLSPATYWTAYAGGYDVEYYDDNEYLSFWLMNIEGENLPNGILSASLDGVEVSLAGVGSLSGHAVGHHDGTYWEAIGGGVWEATDTPATLSAIWGGPDEGTIYSNDIGAPHETGEDIGILLSDVSQWWTPEVPFSVDTAGAFTDDYGNGPYIWNNWIDSLNPEDDLSMTLDKAALTGSTGGILDAGLNGGLCFLYINPDGDIGYAFGGVTADTYLLNEGEVKESMWLGGGELTVYEKASETGIDPQYFVEDYTYEGPLEVDIEGRFGDDGFIEAWGDDHSGYEAFTYYVWDAESGRSSYPFGIFNITLRSDYEDGLGGYFRSGSGEAWNGAIGGDGVFGTLADGSAEWGIWLAGVENGTFSNNKMRAEIVSGDYLTYTHYGNVTGQLWGVYENDIHIDGEEGERGSWIGKVLGTYEGEDLSFVSVIDKSIFPGNGELRSNVLAFERNGFYESEVGYVEGLMGGVDNPLDDKAEAHFLGFCDTYPEDEIEIEDDTEEYYINEGCTWSAITYSRNFEEEANTFYSGNASYCGFLVGDIKDGGTDALFSAIYVDGSNNTAGYIDGALDGGLHSIVEMVKLNGNLESHTMDSDYSGITPTGLMEYLTTEGNYGIISFTQLEGSFGEAGLIEPTMKNRGGFSFVLPGADWGSYAIYELGGKYENPEGSDLWNGVLGGETVDFYPESPTGTGYYLALIEDGTLTDELLKGSFSEGKLFEHTGIADFYGDTIGFINPDNESWQMMAAGHWENMASFDMGVTMTSMEEAGLYYYLPGDGDGAMVEVYDDFRQNPVVGGFGTPWLEEYEGDIDIYAMGRYDFSRPGDDTGSAHQYTGQPLIFSDWKFASYNWMDSSNPTTNYDGSAYIGLLAGAWNKGEINSIGVGMYIEDDEDEPGIWPAGLIYSDDMTGLYYDGIEMFTLNGKWYDEECGEVDFDPSLLVTESGAWNSAYVHENYFSGVGGGRFDDGGTITAGYFDGRDYCVAERNWGIWSMRMGGTYTLPNSPFSLALQSINYEGDVADGVLLATVSSEDWAGGSFTGVLKGVSLFRDYENDGPYISGTMIEGGVAGDYVEVGDGTQTWQAAGVGEWVDVTELLEPEHLGFTLEELETFASVDVPITEVYTNILGMTGGSDFITSAMMDISIFDSTFWAALIEGTYNTGIETTNDWTLNLGADGDSVLLNGTQWSEGDWLADVTGYVDGQDITGQAGGVYYDDGDFEGVGAGMTEEIDD